MAPWAEVAGVATSIGGVETNSRKCWRFLVFATSPSNLVFDGANAFGFFIPRRQRRIFLFGATFGSVRDRLQKVRSCHGPVPCLAPFVGLRFSSALGLLAWFGSCSSPSPPPWLVVCSAVSLPPLVLGWLLGWFPPLLFSWFFLVSLASQTPHWPG